jgi:hypothetical protein
VKTLLSPPVPNQALIVPSYDLVRISRGKKEVDLSPNTLRKYIDMGLPCYRMGKAAFISRTQLQQFIMTKGAAQS